FAPRLEPRGGSGFGRHAADARQVEHAFAFGEREIAEREKRFARRGGDPVRIAPAGVEHGGRGFLGGGAGERDQAVLDFKGAQLIVLLEGFEVGFHKLNGRGGYFINSTMTTPQMVSRVLPTAYGTV